MRSPDAVHLGLGAAWLVLGALAGAGIRRLSVWLARREELEPGFQPWQVWGPPLLAALLFGLAGLVFGPSYVLLIKTLWIAVLVQVIFFDAEHRLILDVLMFPAMALALVLSYFTPHLGWVEALLTGLGAGLLFLVLAVVGAMIFGADALGFGDVKLVAFIGLIVGVHQFAIVQALFWGVFSAGVVALLLVAVRVRSMKDAIPYGPFLAAGALFMLYRLGV